MDDGYYWTNYSITKNGHPVGSFYGHKVVGIFQNQSEIDALNKQAAEKLMVKLLFIRLLRLSLVTGNILMSMAMVISVMKIRQF